MSCMISHYFETISENNIKRPSGKIDWAKICKDISKIVLGDRRSSFSDVGGVSTYQGVCVCV